MCPASTWPHLDGRFPALRPDDRIRLVGAMQTHPGLVRIVNEDVVVYVLPRPGDRFAPQGALALVADGMGGHAAGEVASQLAADIIRRRYYELSGEVPDILAAGFEAANQAIYEMGAADSSRTGMGTTCTVLAVREGMIYLGHVGDSRAYLLRDGRIRQISQDHSVVAELVRAGTITPDEASRSPYRHMVLKALGTKPTIEPLIWSEGLPLRLGDTIILCSDGLSDLLTDRAIAEIAGRQPPLEACRALIAEALAKGGGDNVSLGIFAAVACGDDARKDQVTRTMRAVPSARAPK